MTDLFRDDERARALRPYVLRQAMGQYLTDDERARLWGLGEGCRMRENAKIIAPEKLVCGHHVWIGEGAVLDASGGLEIGDHTSIGLYVMAWSHTSMLANLMGDNVVGSRYITRRPTRIGSRCFIAGHAVIYGGVTLGDATVVLPMTVVTQSLPGNVLVGGSPARVLREIDDAFLDEQLRAAGFDPATERARMGTSPPDEMPGEGR